MVTNYLSSTEKGQNVYFLSSQIEITKVQLNNKNQSKTIDFINISF